MSRAAGTETVYVKPTANVYTVLVICAVLVELIGIIAIAMKHAELFPDVQTAKHLFF